MIRCPSCNALHNPEDPCPGCLVGIGLNPPDPEPTDRRLAAALGLGLVLGLSVSVTGVAALATWVGSATASSSPDLTTERQLLEEEREALEDERYRLQTERERLQATRLRLEKTAVDLDQQVMRTEVERVTTASHEKAQIAAERARQDAERARQQAEAARYAEEAARARAEQRRVAAEHQMELEVERKRAQELARVAADHARLEAQASRMEAERAALEAATRSQRARLAAQSPLALGTACEDLVPLEERAILGKLTDRERSCLDAGRESSNRTQASRVSRLAMVDAFSAGDSTRWRGLAEYHLTHIEEGADIAYKLVLHDAKRGHHPGVLKWSEVALEHRQSWTGKTYTSRVRSLYLKRYEARKALYGESDRRTMDAKSEFEEYQKVSTGRSEVTDPWD